MCKQAADFDKFSVHWNKFGIIMKTKESPCGVFFILGKVWFALGRITLGPVWREIQLDI